MSVDTQKGMNKSIIGLIVVIVLVIATTTVVVMSSDRSAQTTTSNSDTAVTESADSSGSGTNNAAATTGNYKDGTYNATGSYRTPGGQESIGVKVTLTSGVISDISVTQNASGGEAEEYQDAFVSDYKSQVVGKKIDEVSLSRVAGSSLTPNGFNSAITAIKTDAEA